MSADYATRIAQQLADITPTQTKLGVFVARDGFKAIVNLGETTVTLPFVGMHLPPAGHPVQLELRANQIVVTGPARPLPGAGKITGTGAPRAEVTAWGVVYSLPYRSTYVPVLDDDVEIGWSADGGVIQGKVTATTNTVPPATREIVASGMFRPAPFAATDSASHGVRGWNTRDVWASDSYVGAWFYGTKIQDTIPDTAAIRSAAIYLNPRQVQGGDPILQVHTSPTRPGGAVTFTGTGYPMPSRSGWVNIPLTFIDYLKVNPGGIGVNHGGYNIYRGTQSDALSGALDISWEA